MVAVHPGMITPQVVAKMGASLDRISGGRFSIKIVNGWWQEEFDLFSNGTWIGDAERYPRMGEFIQVLKGLWTDPISISMASSTALMSGRRDRSPGQGRHSGCG